MRVTKVLIKNAFGIHALAIDGKSIELTGPKGSGKTSALDCIRVLANNFPERKMIIHQGADEAELFLETDTGLSIERKIRSQKANTLKVRDGDMLQTRPAEFLAGIFTPLQLNPIEFCGLSRQEKNRVILSLIEFDWDMNWIQEEFGEIPQGVDYSKHILEVLSDIQAENGIYFQSRQNLNRDIRNKQAFIADIARDIPDNYDYAKWENYPIGEKYRELERIKENNGVIERAKGFAANFAAKKRGIEAERDIAISAAEKETAARRTELTAQIAKMQEQLFNLEGELKAKKEVAEAKANEKLAKLEKDIGIAMEYADREPEDTFELDSELQLAEKMRKHLNEYKRMQAMRGEVSELSERSAELTRKIELGRELPSEILREATIPIEGLSVVDGEPLINGLPISNLSDGELLDLCVDITVSQPSKLDIILIDGAERLDTKSREKLYKKCKDKGLQIIATRVTDSDELEIIEL